MTTIGLFWQERGKEERKKKEKDRWENKEKIKVINYTTGRGHTRTPARPSHLRMYARPVPQIDCDSDDDSDGDGRQTGRKKLNKEISNFFFFPLTECTPSNSMTSSEEHIVSRTHAQAAGSRSERSLME